MKVLPSVDISEGKAVKRIQGKRGTGLVLGDPRKVAEEIYSMGYKHLHVVDLDAAEGVGDNSEFVRDIVKIGFEWVQVGGGVRDSARASKLLSQGASAVIMSTLPFTDPKKFETVVKEVGPEKVLVSVDYDSQGYVLIKGWTERSLRMESAIASLPEVRGVILTFVDKEGTTGGIDPNAGKWARLIKGLKEYAGGISSPEDLASLKSMGFDYAVVGMAFYTGRVRGIVEV
ncbi:MAG: 1-(5-phosphoribosyl)-5-((5-phosphoribosylamino)methylideneamino)imidazole-4-carboxamide isomerase [Thermoprotei archaeon]